MKDESTDSFGQKYRWIRIKNSPEMHDIVYHCIPLYTSSTPSAERHDEEGGRAANVVQKRGKKQVETGSTYEEGDVWIQ